MYFWLFQVSVLETTTGSLAMSWTGLTCRKIWSNNFLWNLYLINNESTVRLKLGNLRLGSFCIFPVSRFCALDILASAGNKDTKKFRDRKQEVWPKIVFVKKSSRKAIESLFSLSASSNIFAGCRASLRLKLHRFRRSRSSSLSVRMYLNKLICDFRNTSDHSLLLFVVANVIRENSVGRTKTLSHF